MNIIGLKNNHVFMDETYFKNSEKYLNPILSSFPPRQSGKSTLIDNNGNPTELGMSIFQYNALTKNKMVFTRGSLIQEHLNENYIIKILDVTSQYSELIKNKLCKIYILDSYGEWCKK